MSYEIFYMQPEKKSMTQQFHFILEHAKSYTNNSLIVRNIGKQLEFT